MGEAPVGYEDSDRLSRDLNAGMDTLKGIYCSQGSLSASVV